MSRWLWTLCLFILPLTAQAVVIQFPEDELARESVLPVFERKVAVRNRTVVTEGRFEFGINFGYSLVEPFFNPYNLGVSASYHINEFSAINVMSNAWSSGGTKYTTQLQNDYQTNLNLAPSVQNITMLNYQYTAYYGKMSLAKNLTINQSLFGLLGVANVAMGQQSMVAGSVGLGQKFYWTPDLALRFDLRLLLFQGPNVASKSLRNETMPKPPSFFEQTLIVYSVLNVGLVYLF